MNRNILKLIFKFLSLNSSFRRSFFLSIPLIVLASLTPTFFRWYLAKSVVTNYEDNIIYGIGFLLIFTILAFIIRIFSWMSIEIKGSSSTVFLMKKIFAKVSNLKIYNITNRGTSDFIGRLSVDAKSIREDFVISIGDFCSDNSLIIDEVIFFNSELKPFNQSKITFFQVPSDSRRELACSKKLYPTKDNLQIIATKESCYIIDDFVEGKTLSDILKDMHKNPIDYSNQRILNLVKLSIQAMYFVRSQGVIHGDFKPENIIISPSETTARVIDFGGSVVIPEDGMLLQKKVKDFTLHYVPPEQQHEVSHEQLTATETLDLNAAALIVVFLCAGYGYDDCGLDERRLKYNLFRNKEKKYDSYITKWSDHIKSDVNHPHDLELQKDLNKIASTISSFGATGAKLQALFDRVLAEIPENRGTFSQLLDEVIQIEKNYEEPLRARRLSF